MTASGASAQASAPASRAAHKAGAIAVDRSGKATGGKSKDGSVSALSGRSIRQAA